MDPDKVLFLATGLAFIGALIAFFGHMAEKQIYTPTWNRAATVVTAFGFILYFVGCIMVITTLVVG